MTISIGQWSISHFNTFVSFSNLKDYKAPGKKKEKNTKHMKTYTHIVNILWVHVNTILKKIPPSNVNITSFHISVRDFCIMYKMYFSLSTGLHIVLPTNHYATNKLKSMTTPQEHCCSGKQGFTKGLAFFKIFLWH